MTCPLIVFGIAYAVKGLCPISNQSLLFRISNELLILIRLQDGVKGEQNGYVSRIPLKKIVHSGDFLK